MTDDRPVIGHRFWNEGILMLDPARLHRWSSGWLETADSLVYPMTCQICGDDESHVPICEACQGELREANGRACRRCALPIGPWALEEKGCSRCRGKALGFDRALALGPYQGPIRHLCIRLKGERDGWIAATLVDLLIEAHGEALRDEAGAEVVAIPLHWWKHWRRGYNQAEALAVALAQRLGLRVIRPIRRVVATPKLAQVGRVERVAVMRRAFRARRGAGLAGRSLLLVDDILTTGATCGAAARVLKRAGAKRVTAVVVARAEGRV